MEGRDYEEEEGPEGEKILPALKEGEDVELNELHENQHFTKPPPRYTEASLVKNWKARGLEGQALMRQQLLR